MYLISILALVAAMIGMCFFEGLSPAWLIDTPSILLILLITIPMLLSAGLLKDFNNAFRFVVGKKKVENIKELRRSVEAVSLAIKVTLFSGVLISVIQCVVILGTLDNPEKLGPMLCVSILAVVYALGLSLLMLPLRTQLQVKIIEYLSEAE